MCLNLHKCAPVAPIRDTSWPHATSDTCGTVRPLSHVNLRHSTCSPGKPSRASGSAVHRTRSFLPSPLRVAWCCGRCCGSTARSPQILHRPTFCTAVATAACGHILHVDVENQPPLETVSDFQPDMGCVCIESIVSQFSKQRAISGNCTATATKPGQVPIDIALAGVR